MWAFLLLRDIKGFSLCRYQGTASAVPAIYFNMGFSPCWFQWLKPRILKYLFHLQYISCFMLLDLKPQKLMDRFHRLCVT